MHEVADPQLFLVCGARRTGTTLLAAVLSADTSAPPLPGEAQLLPRWLESYQWAKQAASIRIEPFFDDHAHFATFYRRLLYEFVSHCSDHFRPSSSIVLKSPELSLVFPEAVELFDTAKFIVMVRDPRDQVASEWNVVDRRRAGPSDLRVLETRDFGSLANHYVRYYAPILDVLTRGSDRIHVQRYEDLVLAPDHSLNTLEEFTGLDLSGFNPDKAWPRVADSYWAYGTSPSDTPHYAQPIERARVGSYLEVLTKAEERLVASVCDATASQLGYRLSTP